MKRARRESVLLMITAGRSEEDISGFVRSQAESLAAEGWKVVFAIVSDRTSVQGIRRNVRRIRREVEAVKPSVVHAQYGSMIAAIGRMVRQTSPLVISFCGDDLLGTPEPGFARRVRERLARYSGLWAAEAASAILVKSDNLYRSLPSKLRSRATVLPNGVDVNRFTALSKEACREKLGWAMNLKVVLFNASLNDNQPVKNPALARETISRLSDSIPGVTLHMMSDASQEEVILMLNAADCLLVTSLHEGSPNIVKEAMACNLPVVSVPCGDVAKRLKNVFPGGVRPYDAGALADAIHQVLNSNARSNGREHLLAQGLTTKKIAENLIQVYRKAQTEPYSQGLD